MPQSVQRLQAALSKRYALERVIGSGGMATVYLAEDKKHRRQVALKVLRPELAAELGAERFLREIEIVAQLQHPHILPLYDSGHARGLLYYVMPFVAGGSLRGRLKRDERLPLEDAVRLTRAVALALDYAHRRDVVHRDIKPENILLSEGEPVLADFGIARAPSPGHAGELTAGGLAVGTPTYMSPEQVTAERTLDGRSDLYSLGCVLYEMLAGQPPFVGPSARATMALHAVRPPPAIRTARPDVPDYLDRALSRALAKEPGDRFACLQEFAHALTGPGRVPPATIGAPVPIGKQAIAVLPFVNTSADPEHEYFSDGVTDELIDALAKVERLQVVSRTSSFAFKGSQRDVRDIGMQLDVSVVLEGTVRKAGQRIRITAQLTNVADGRHLWSERYDRDLEDVFAVQEELARTIVNTLRRTLVGDVGEPVPKRYTENLRAHTHYLKGRYFLNQRSPEGFAKATEHFEHAIAADPDYALAHTGLADSYSIQLDYRGVPVAEGMERARREAQRALDLDDELAQAHTSLAWVQFIYDWNWDAAERGFQRAIALNPSYATAHQWYAWLLMARNCPEDALGQARASLELDPISISIRRSLGWLYYYARQTPEAVAHLRQAVARDPTSEESHRVLGLALTQHQRFDEAATAFREALAISPESPYSLAGQGLLEARRGQPEHTKAVLEQLTQMTQHRYVSPVAFTMVLVALGEHDRAFEWLERAYRERRGWLAYLEVEPVLDPLRSDRRFTDLVERMGLGGRGPNADG